MGDSDERGGARGARVVVTRDARAAGLSLWQSRDELSRSRRWARWTSLGLGVLAALWLAGLTGSDVDGDVVLGIAILELFTLVPFVVSVVRLRRLNRLLARIDELGAEELQEMADDLRSADETLAHIGRLVARLRPGAARDAGEEALAAAEASTVSRRRLRHRQADLEQLVATTRSSSARRTLQKALKGCRRELAESQALVEELAVAVAGLVDAAEEDLVQRELERVRDVTERTAAMAAVLQELQST
jgi:hypothetical protein